MKTLLLIFTILAGTSLLAQTSETKRPLDTTLISYVQLVKVTSAKPLILETRQLNTFHYTNFADTWNSKRPTGADKFKPSYYIYVYLKDSAKRQFTIGGSKVQEQSWMTIDLGDKLYFDKLWKAVK